MSPVAYGIQPIAGGDPKVAARVFLYRLLADSMGITDPGTVDHDPQGRPFLPSHPSLYISISHCRTAVAAAIALVPVGIDVESRRRVGESLIARVCTPAEQAAVQSAHDPTMHFLQLWTKKEAILKCRGTGITGFTSLTEALACDDLNVQTLHTGLPGTVASLAIVKGE